MESDNSSGEFRIFNGGGGGEVANPKGGFNLFFGQIFLKTAWKWRKLDRDRERGYTFEFVNVDLTLIMQHEGVKKVMQRSLSATLWERWKDGQQWMLFFEVTTLGRWQHQ